MVRTVNICPLGALRSVQGLLGNWQRNQYHTSAGQQYITILHFLIGALPNLSLPFSPSAEPDIEFTPCILLRPS